MYVPKHFSVIDRTVMIQFMRDHDFATLVTAGADGPIGSHLLFEIEEAGDGGVSLNGHMARANAQHQSFETGREALVIFQGPHTYVSPEWYESPGVPTWNYQAVHAYGAPSIIEDRDAVYGMLKRLVHRHESREHPGGSYSLDALSPNLVEPMLKAIVAFHIPVTRIEASFKLSQNKTRIDHDRVVLELRRRGDAESRSVADAMERRAEGDARRA
jgi:transcriptional regulator